MHPITLSKMGIRKKMLEKRRAISKTERAECSRKIESKLFRTKEFRAAKTIVFYLSKPDEVDTFEMIAAARRMKKNILVPVTNDEIEVVKFTSFDDLVPARFGVPEPKTKRRASLSTIDLVVVPGVSFDSDCHRLGFGKGYYDKFLKKLSATKIGICFDFQLVDILPRHHHDERMDVVITEKRIIRWSR